MKLTKAIIQQLCEAGGMAPSGGNTQPWKVFVKDNVMELKLDPERASSFLDVGRLASIFSLGSFFENLSIVAASLGLNYEVKLHKFKTIKDTIATIVFNDKKAKHQQVHTLQPFISKRVTNRQMFDGTILDEAIINTLVKEVTQFSPNYTLTCLSNYEEKEKLITLLGKADGIRTMHDTLMKQMFSELRWSHEEAVRTKDGIDMATMELPANAPVLFKQMKDHPFVRNMLPRKVFEDMAKPLLRGSSHLCVLSMSVKPDTKNMFLAGQIMERLWLVATRLGLAVQPWSIFTFFLLRVEHFSAEGFNQKEADEIEQLGKTFRELLQLSKNEIPLFIFRLSKAKPPSANSIRLHWRDYTNIKA